MIGTDPVRSIENMSGAPDAPVVETQQEYGNVCMCARAGVRVCICVRVYLCKRECMLVCACIRVRAHLCAADLHG